MISIRKYDKGRLSVLQIAAVMAIAAGAMVPPASAAEPALSDNLYAAAYAEEECGAGKFSQAQWQRLVGEISKRGSINNEVGDMLTFVDDTHGKVADMKRMQGCGAPELDFLRAKFARDLQPAL